MLYVVGLGLSDEKDITVKGLEAVRSCARIYLEYYTSILTVPTERLEAFYGKPVIPAYRETVELEADEILRDADKEDVAFLVAGDPLSATTHTDLILRARDLSIPVQVIHNTSILTALGSTGLQLYNFGQTLSLPFYTETWQPASWYDRLEENLRYGMHTCVLLDIKVREQSEENMARGRLIYEPPRFMNPQTAFSQILLTESQRHPSRSVGNNTVGSGGGTGASQEPATAESSTTSIATFSSTTTDPLPPVPGTLCPPAHTLAIALSRMGTPDQTLISGTLEELAQISEEEYGGPLHTVVIVGKRLHPLELEYAGQFAVGGEEGKWWSVGRDVYGVQREGR